MFSFGLLLSLVSFFSFWEDFLHKRSLSKSSFSGACFLKKKKKVYRFFSADFTSETHPFPLLNSFLCTFLLVGFMPNGARVATTRQGPLCSPPGGQGVVRQVVDTEKKQGSHPDPCWRACSFFRQMMSSPS